MSIRTWVQWLSNALLLVSIGTAGGCSEERPPKSDLSRNDLKPEPPPVADGGVRACTRPGCACKHEGATRECGTISEQVAGYLWCSLGVQVCEEGVWSECESERVVLSKQMRNLRLQGLGESRSCADDNPCSPGCNLFQDDAGGLPLEPGDGLTEGDDGLELAESDNLPGGSCTSIEVTPSTSELEVASLEPVSPNTATFTARILPEGCAGENREVAWSVDRPDVATISASGVVTLHSAVAGPIEVSALAGRLSGSATLDVRVVIADTSEAPPDADSHFGAPGEAADSRLNWLYPYAGTVFPPNVNAPVLQWGSVVAAEASWNGGCALRSDGRVRCWGTNVYGEIVDQPGSYVQIAGRYAHFCALSASGAAHCWGDNSYNQSRDRAGPFVQVAVGTQHSCALRPDGTVECWGRNQYGQSSPPSGRFTKLASGAYTSCGIRENGDVECWGNGSSGQAGTTPGPFIEVAAGNSHVCAIRRDRSIACWGSANDDQTSAPAGHFVSLDAGTYHTCALATDGRAECWGDNSHGQSTTVAGPFVGVTAAREHSCAVSVTGAVECFGDSDGNRTVGLPGGSVRVALRYPATGDATFEWSAVVAESRGYSAGPPVDEVPLPPAPRYPIPDAVWSALAASARGQEFTFSIQRHTGDRLLEAVERSARFSDSPLTGKIVYQSYGSRTVQNSVGTYEDADEGWGAALFSYDTNTKASAVVAGFTSDSSTSGTDAGCRGCHSLGADNHLLLAGFDNQRDAVVRSLTTPTEVERALTAAAREHGGALWSAVHPTLPLAFSSRGPTPCAVRIGETSGSCAVGEFTSAAGDLAGAGYVLQSAPGALLGSAWFDADGDGTYDTASPNQFLDLGETNAGTVIDAELPDAFRAAMPVFSPEGDRVVFVHYAGDMTDGVGSVYAGDRRSLGMMDFDSASLQLYNFQRIAAEPEEPCDTRFGGAQACADVWPSFLPGGSGVVFQRQVFGNSELAGTAHSELGGTRSGCEVKDQASCDDGAKGDLWWVPLDSDGQPTGRYRLERASGVVASDHLVTDGASTTPGVSHSNEVEPLLSYQPSAAPRAYGSHRWLAFTSRRAYGNIATQNPWWSDPRVHPIGHDVATKKLWVSALDATADGQDPSAPAFYLEGQELRGANGRPVWVNDACVEAATERSAETECANDADCCGAPETSRCEVALPLSSPVVRHCVPIEDSCVDAESARLCQADEECCGFDAGERCMSGRCSVPPPLARYERATFVRDYQAECPDGTLPQWKFLEWRALLPTGTSIQFDAATAATEAELEAAAMVYQATASPPDAATWTTWGTADADSISAKLNAEGYPSMEWLRVGITLIPDPSQAYTPALQAWRLVYDCADGL